MKKLGYIAWCGAVLLLVSACSKDLPDGLRISDKVIEFAAPELSVGVEEDAALGRAPIESLPDNSSFGVLGYCLSQVAPDNPELNHSSGKFPWNQKKVLSRPHLFYNTQVTCTPNGCTYDNPVKWYADKDFLYTFFAYYPYGNGGGFSLLTNQSVCGAPKLKFSIPFDSQTVDTELDMDQVPDAMVADDCFDVTRAGGEVNLVFRHILTGLNVTVNNYNETTLVSIHSLKLSGTFYKSLEMTLGERTTYLDNETFSGTYSFLKDTEATVTVSPHESSKEVGGRTVLLVSNLNGGYLGKDDLRITINYTFGGEPKTQSFGRPENFLPEPGTIYSAQLNFIGNAFVLEFVIDNDSKWEDGGDSDISFG